jgi:putative hydrolase of the HAD superfamily
MSAADFFRRMRERFCVEIEFEEFGRIWNSIFYEDGEVSGMVRALKAAGHTLYLLSNTNELHYGFIERNFPIVGVFDRHILSHRIGARKPEKRIYEEIFRHTDVPPHETLFIDDMEENIRGAVEMGLLTHHFTGAGGLRERLAAEGVKGI